MEELINFKNKLQEVKELKKSVSESLETLSSLTTQRRPASIHLIENSYMQRVETQFQRLQLHCSLTEKISRKNCQPKKANLKVQQTEIVCLKRNIKKKQYCLKRTLIDVVMHIKKMKNINDYENVEMNYAEELQKNEEKKEQHAEADLLEEPKKSQEDYSEDENEEYVDSDDFEYYDEAETDNSVDDNDEDNDEDSDEDNYEENDEENYEDNYEDNDEDNDED